jgi:hypothetical protein
LADIMQLGVWPYRNWLALICILNTQEGSRSSIESRKFYLAPQRQFKTSKQQGKLSQPMTIM